MDPNANLAEQASILAGRTQEPAEPYSEIDAPRLRELRVALDQWLYRGGFEPDWTAYPDATHRFYAWINSGRKA